MTRAAARRAEAVVVERATAITFWERTQKPGQSARLDSSAQASFSAPHESRRIPAFAASLDARDALAHARQRRWNDAANRGVYQLDRM